MKQIFLLLLLSVSPLAFSSNYSIQFRSEGEKKAFNLEAQFGPLDAFRICLYAGDLKQEGGFEKAVADFEVFLNEVALKIKDKRTVKEAKIIQKMVKKKYAKYLRDDATFAETAINAIANNQNLTVITTMVLNKFSFPYWLVETEESTVVKVFEGLDVYEISYFPERKSKTSITSSAQEFFLKSLRGLEVIPGKKNWPFSSEDFQKYYYKDGVNNLKEISSGVFAYELLWQLDLKDWKKIMGIAQRAYYLDKSHRNWYHYYLAFTKFFNADDFIASEHINLFAETDQISIGAHPNNASLLLLDKLLLKNDPTINELPLIEKACLEVKHDSTRNRLMNQFYAFEAIYFNNRQMFSEAVRAIRKMMEFPPHLENAMNVLQIIEYNLGNVEIRSITIEDMQYIKDVSVIIDSIEYPKHNLNQILIDVMMYVKFLRQEVIPLAELEAKFDAVLKLNWSKIEASDYIVKKWMIYAETTQVAYLQNHCKFGKKVATEGIRLFPDNHRIQDQYRYFKNACK